MKKTKFIAICLAVITVASMTLPLLSCSGARLYSEGEGDLNVVCSSFTPFDFARTVGGEKATVTILQDTGADLHNYAPTSAAIMAVKKADVFICVGGSSDDAWLSTLLRSAGDPQIPVIKLTEHADLLPTPLVISQDHDHEHEGEHEDEHGEECEHDHSHDEHVWTSLKNASKAISAIADAFAEKDAANAEFYRANATEYISKLNALDAEYTRAVSEGKRKTVVFADRFPFVYMTNDYGLDYSAAFSGCSTEVNASIETTKLLIDAVKSGNLPYILICDVDPSKAPAVANTVANSTGAKILSMNSCQSVTRSAIQGGATYLDIMTQNLNVLKEALS